MDEQPKNSKKSIGGNEQHILDADKDTFPYNSDFAADNWQHYYDYKSEDGKATGICRTFLKY